MDGTGEERRYPSHDPAASTYYPWNCRAVLRNLCGGNDPGFNSGNCKRPVEKKQKQSECSALEGEKGWDLRGFSQVSGISFAVLIPFCFYILSNSFAVEEHAGATGRSPGRAFNGCAPPFRCVSFKVSGGMLIGGEELIQWISDGKITDGFCYLLGLLWRQAICGLYG